MTAAVVCLIPAYNAAATVAGVVSGLRAALPHARVVGIDDGSTDDTAQVLRAGCDDVLSLPRNQGKGAALRAGFTHALACGAASVLTLDADGQHDPAFAPSLVVPLVAADVVVGTRTRAGGMPIRRRITNALSAAAARRLAGCDVGDIQSGFRALRADVLRVVQARGDRYEFETDFLMRAARAGLKIVSVPVPTIYGPPSHFREVRDGLRVVATFCRHVGGAVS